MPKPTHNEKEPTPVSRSFAAACVLVLFGLVALTLAIQLLLKIWVYLLVAALLVVGCWVVWVVTKARRNRW